VWELKDLIKNKNSLKNKCLTPIPNKDQHLSIKFNVKKLKKKLMNSYQNTNISLGVYQ